MVTRVRISGASAPDYKTTYSWDYRDRLTDVSFFNNSGSLTQHVHYVYDVWDHLIERDLDPNGSGTFTQIVHYVWDGDNIVLAFNASDQLIARYINGPNTSAFDQTYTTLAEEDVTSTSVAGTVTFPLLDQQASVVDVVDSSGNLIDHIVYVSTGAVWSESNPSVSHLASWQGGMADSATGLENFYHRWYILADGIWASQDPLGFGAGDTNLSRVAFNNLANLSDPSGLEVRDDGEGTVRVVQRKGFIGFRTDQMLGSIYYGVDGDEARHEAALRIARRLDSRSDEFGRIVISDENIDGDVTDAKANTIYLKDCLQRHPDAEYGQPDCGESFGASDAKPLPKNQQRFTISRPAGALASDLADAVILGRGTPEGIESDTNTDDSTKNSKVGYKPMREAAKRDMRAESRAAAARKLAAGADEALNGLSEVDVIIVRYAGKYYYWLAQKNGKSLPDESYCRSDGSIIIGGKSIMKKWFEINPSTTND